MLIYPTGLLDAIRTALVDSHRTVAVAESVTAGLLQNALSQATDARLFFQGEMTVYNVAQKCRQLDIEPIQAQQDNGVSEWVAIQLATHITKVFCSQVGIALVGYATPVPEKEVMHPFAWYAICADGQLLEAGCIAGRNGNALDNQIHYVEAVISTSHRLLCHPPLHLPKKDHSHE